MSDLISREAVLDALKAIPDHNDGMVFETLSHALRDIELLPSAEQWIPVSERLPEVGRNVLLSVGKGLYTAEGELKHDGTWVQYRWSANIENVDAWAEMPEPWRGEEDE